MALDSIAQADADHKELQQLAETLGLKEVDEPLYAADDLQGLVQSSAYEPGDARLSPGVLSPGRLSLPTSEDLLRTPPPSQLAVRPAMAPGSQAVVAAMRALQERVRELTHDNVGLAAEAGMSRARFAVKFRDTVGMTPGSYLSEWRLGLAQSLLRRGTPVNVVADEVGYANASALSRVFTARKGEPPTAWVRRVAATDEPDDPA